MKKTAPPVNSLDAILDRQIGELVASESRAALPPGDTSAGGTRETDPQELSPLEAAVLSMSHDLVETLRLARTLQEQGRMLETVARALSADMAEVKAAIRGANIQHGGLNLGSLARMSLGTANGSNLPPLNRCSGGATISDGSARILIEEKEGLFGNGSARETVLIGATCCEVGFGQEEEQLEELSSLNPLSTIARLREELATATAINELLISPRASRGRVGE